MIASIAAFVVAAAIAIFAVRLVCLIATPALCQAASRATSWVATARSVVVTPVATWALYSAATQG